MRYQIDDRDLTLQRRMWCSNCKHTWVQPKLSENFAKTIHPSDASPKHVSNPALESGHSGSKVLPHLSDEEGNLIASQPSEYGQKPTGNINIPFVILVAGSMCVLLAMGLRASFGLFLIPMLSDLEWNREIFAIALALQNLFWGLLQPFASAAAEKWGTGRIIALGGALYAAGLYLMGNVSNPTTLHISAGLMIGAAQSGCALAVVLGAVGRAMPEKKRSWGLGIVMAAGGVGQFTVVPMGQALLQSFNWSSALVLFSALACAIIFCAYPLRTSKASTSPPSNIKTTELLSMSNALREAFFHKGFWLLTIGFYVCGFHVAFIAVHLPAYLTDLGLPSSAGAWAISVIGIFNIFGSYVAGILGDKLRKKYLLSFLYFARAAVFLIFLLLPVTFGSVIFFSACLGLLWLSTVPLTSGLVAQIFGTRYMGTLFGIVFLSHQIGSFMGIWLGGYLFDYYGSYSPVWWAGVFLGFAAAIIHWPINDRAIVRSALSH